MYVAGKQVRLRVVAVGSLVAVVAFVGIVSVFGSGVVSGAPTDAATSDLENTSGVVASVSAAQDSTIIVDKDGNGDYETIQAAIENASDGDTIAVRAGTYSGFFISENVTLVTNSAVIQGAIRFSDTNVSPTIEGFTIEQRPNEEESFYGASILATESTGDWVLRDITAREGVGLSAPGAEGDWKIVDSVFLGDDDYSLITVRDAEGNWRIEGSYIGTANRLSIRADDAGGGVVSENTILGQVSAFGTDLDARSNYWGQPGGPREVRVGDRFESQCWGEFDCSNPLSSPPVVAGELAEDDDNDDTPDAQPPTAILNVDRRTLGSTVFAGTGDELTFDASQSVAPQKVIRDYDWTVSGPTTAHGDGEQFTTTFSENGTYTVNLTINDGTRTGSAELTVQVFERLEDAPAPGNDTGDGVRGVPDNIPPLAALDPASNTVPTGESLSFSAAESTDPDGTTLTYRWDFDGDGETEFEGTNPTATYSYDESGEYEAALTVVDSAGARDTATVSVRVDAASEFPTAEIDARPNEGEEFVAGVPISFNAGESTAGSTREVAAYEWEFGDGTTQRVTPSLAPKSGDERGAPTVEHTYDEPGNYTVTLTLVGSQGLESQVSRDIEVGNSTVPQVSLQSTEKPGQMIRGVGLENDYFLQVTGEEEIDEVTLEFPTGDTREATQINNGPREGAWVVRDVAIDELTEPGTNTVEVEATDVRGETGTGSFSIGAFEPPGWFEFMLGDSQTVTRDDQQRWVLRSSEPTVPPDSLLGPEFNFQVPIENISGVFDLGIGANYGFEYVFADSQGTATGNGKLTLSTPIDGVTVDADIGGGKKKGSASQSFTFELGGTVGIDENAERARLEGAKVAFGTQVSATRPVYGVGVPVPKSDTTVGVTVDVTLSKGFEPGVELAVNDERTALEPSRITLTETVGVEISAGAGGSVGTGGITVGLEARGYAAGKGSFTIEVYPNLEAAKASVTLEAGVKGCLGPCIKEPLIKGTFPLLDGDSTTNAVRIPAGAQPLTTEQAATRP